MQHLTLAEVQPSELEQLRQMAESTFISAFGHLNDPHDMTVYVAQAFNLRRIKSEFQNPHSRFFFAKSNGKRVGYLKLNWGDAQSENELANAIEVERIYVLDTHRGNGIGKWLMQQAFEIACDIGHDHIWLGVWEKNQDAIRFYESQGFESFSTHSFFIGSDEQTDILMKKKLK